MTTGTTGQGERQAATRQAVMSPSELTAFLDREFPQLLEGGRGFLIEEAGHRRARMRLVYSEKHLRPGGTISGPAMFALADLSLYAAILASIGPVALAVTTSLTINYLRLPAKRDLIAQCRLLKLGKRLAVGDVLIHSEGEEEPVAQASGTYSIPPER